MNSDRRADRGVSAVNNYLLAMREFASGVTIITAAGDGVRCGLTATAVCSLSNDPPSMIACVNRSADTHPLIRQGRRFCINLLSIDQQSLADVFSGRTGVDGEDRFRELGDWKTGACGLPVLTDALASISCDLEEAVNVKTHTIFLGSVRYVELNRKGKPLIYVDRRYGTVAEPQSASG